jgi:hypothetical protein
MILSNFVIYGLTDPRPKYITRPVRYVGQSVQGLRRAAQHACKCVLDRDNTYCGCWKRKLQRMGLKYGIVTLETVEHVDMLTPAECKWIAYGRAAGWHLTNLTDGGEGTRGFRPTEITRAKMRAVHRANVAQMTPEQRYALTAYTRTPEARAKRQAALSTPEYRALRLRIATGHKGTPLTLDARARLLNAAQSPAARAKRTETLRGRVVTAATRERIAATKRGKRNPISSEHMKSRLQTAAGKEQFRRMNEAAMTPEARARSVIALRTWQASEAGRAMIAATAAKLRGRVMPQEHRDAIRRAMANPDVRKRISEKAKGRVVSAETRAHMSAAGKGRKHSPESIERTAAAHRGMKRSPEAHARMSAAQRGRRCKPLSAAVRAKYSAARSAWWLRKREAEAAALIPLLGHKEHPMFRGKQPCV